MLNYKAEQAYQDAAYVILGPLNILDCLQDRPPGLEGDAIPEKCVKLTRNQDQCVTYKKLYGDGEYMHKGSLMCRHGEEAGKACEICYNEWKLKNDLYT